MPNYASMDGIVGTQQAAFYLLPDTTQRMKTGSIVPVTDPYWGGAELMYVKATGTITQSALCIISSVFNTNTWDISATVVPNTPNLAQSVGIACTSATVGQFFWLLVAGTAPVKSGASVAADTSFGITAAGTVGAVAAGKQILGGRIQAAATTTVIKTNCVNNAGSNQLSVPNSDGWFAGVYLSGTGVGAACTVTDISPDGRTVTMSAVSTAAISGSVTATYNNATIFYNVAYVNRPFAQGAIT